MNAWWFSLVLLATVSALIQSRRTLRLYFFAQLVNVLAVFVFSHWLTGWYLAAYVCTTVPILECSIFLLWDMGGLSDLQVSLAIGFSLVIAALAAEYAGAWGIGKMVTFAEGVLLAVLGMGMALVTVGKREWAAIRTIGALSLTLAWYDFAFVRGWKEPNNWLPAAICAVAFWKIALQDSSAATA